MKKNNFASFAILGVVCGCILNEVCATDATRYIHLNLPTVIFGATGFGTHAKQERVSLQSLVEYTEMFTEYLIKY